MARPRTKASEPDTPEAEVPTEGEAVGGPDGVPVTREEFNEMQNELQRMRLAAEVDDEVREDERVEYYHTDDPLWEALYQRAIKLGNSEKAAVNYADTHYRDPEVENA